MSTTSQITSMRKTLRTALMAAQGIALLRGVLDDAASRAVLTLLAALAGPDPADAPVAGAFGRAFGELATVADEEPVHGLADAWQAHLTARLLDDPALPRPGRRRLGPSSCRGLGAVDGPGQPASRG